MEIAINCAVEPHHLTLLEKHARCVEKSAARATYRLFSYTIVIEGKRATVSQSVKNEKEREKYRKKLLALAARLGLQVDPCDS